MTDWIVQAAGMAVALLAVLALAWVLLRLLARHAGGRPGAAGTLRVERVLALGGRERLVLVHHADEELLLGVTPSGIRLLHRQARPTGGDLRPRGPGSASPSDPAPP
jgi:flagellar protein FliO/FliZ